MIVMDKAFLPCQPLSNNIADTFVNSLASILQKLAQKIGKTEHDFGEEDEKKVLEKLLEILKYVLGEVRDRSAQTKTSTIDFFILEGLDMNEDTKLIYTKSLPFYFFRGSSIRNKPEVKIEKGFLTANMVVKMTKEFDGKVLTFDFENMKIQPKKARIELCWQTLPEGLT